MKFVFELLTAVVWPKWEVSNSAMFIIPVVLRIDLEHWFNEVCDLLIALIEIRSNTSVGAARYCVLLKVPVINNYDKEDRFGAAEKG